MDGALKVKNYPLLAGFLFGYLWLLHLVILGRAPDIGWLKDFSMALPTGVAATIIGVALNELVAGSAKVRLLFPSSLMQKSPNELLRELSYATTSS
jgi:hypothetical protein